MTMFDVAVVGGGNAGLSAALTAREAGASVIVVECAPRAMRGGNSRHTRNLRCRHDAPTDLLSGAYGEQEFFDDLLRITGGTTDEPLARIVVRGSAECLPWMARHGARFQSSLRGTFHLSRTNVFFLGGGKALLNAYYASAERLGVAVRYATEVVELDVEGGSFRSAVVRTAGASERLTARAVVLAAGGFEANLEWLRDAWGPAADNFIVRGTPYNRGTVLRMMLDKGARSIGDATECHAVAVDARAPKFDGGIVTRLDCVPLGIVVNKRAERFHDEGEDFWPKRYAIWGRLVAAQPDQMAFSIIDAKAIESFIPSVFPPIVSNSIGDLAGRLGLEPSTLEATVARFNGAVRPGTYNRDVRDDCRTEGLHPRKSHWARPIDTPPFWAYPLRPGITFTYLGLKTDEQARVVMSDGRAADNIFAAGEIMAGNVLRQGYVAGVGMTIGAVFGRIAGRGAARHAGR
jgi:tricarballylate dehydrogenase